MHYFFDSITTFNKIKTKKASLQRNPNNQNSHRSEYIYKEADGGLFQRVAVRTRPGTVALAAAIQHKYNITAVPHIICSGFSKAEIEYSLIDLNFLGINDLLLLRGDKAKHEMRFVPEPDGHAHAIELQSQVNDFNKGFFIDGSQAAINTPFSYGVAGYPEKHDEAPNIEQDLKRLKDKVDNGADYVVTQMFFDNSKYFEFVERCREIGITVPIIPGLKPLSTARQVTMLPESFSLDIPVELTDAIAKAKDDKEAVYRIGTEWCAMQCKDLISNGVPAVHFYTMGKSRNIVEILRECF